MGAIYTGLIWLLKWVRYNTWQCVDSSIIHWAVWACFVSSNHLPKRLWAEFLVRSVISWRQHSGDQNFFIVSDHQRKVYSYIFCLKCLLFTVLEPALGSEPYPAMYLLDHTCTQSLVWKSLQLQQQNSLGSFNLSITFSGINYSSKIQRLPIRKLQVCLFFIFLFSFMVEEFKLIPL